jgi:hypothetical protein
MPSGFVQCALIRTSAPSFSSLSRMVPQVASANCLWDHAAYFAQLAEAEPVEKIRDQWTTLARDYAYLASALEPDGGLSRGATLYPMARTSPVAGDD